MNQSEEKSQIIALGRGGEFTRDLGQRLRGHLNQLSCPVELDLSEGLECPCSAESVLQLVVSLIDAALQSSPGKPELLVTACCVDGALEVEVADNGPSLSERPRRLPLIAAQLNAQVYWQDCPQGGVAVTAVFPAVSRQRRAA